MSIGPEGMPGDCKGAIPDSMDRQRGQQTQQIAVKIFVSKVVDLGTKMPASGGVDVKKESEVSTGAKERVFDVSFHTRK